MLLCNSLHNCPTGIAMEVILVHRAGLVWFAVELTSHSCMWNPSPLSSTHYLHLFFEGPQFFSLYYMFIGEEVDVTVIPSVQTCRAVLWSFYCGQNACELYFWILAASPGPSVSITNAWRMSTEIIIFRRTHTRAYLFMIAMWCGCIEWACGTVICTTWVWMGIWDTVSVSFIL